METVGNRTISRDELMEAEEDLNSALDEALETYDLATSWMEGDGEKEVVRKFPGQRRNSTATEKRSRIFVPFITIFGYMGGWLRRAVYLLLGV